MSRTIFDINEAKKRRYDEYYTRYEHVAHIFEDIIPKDALRAKIIYLPCDSDESNFTKYLRDHEADIKYRALINTSDDYNTHLDIFEYCDIIITNPPFSKLCSEFIPLLNNVKKKFFILGGKITAKSYFNKFDDIDNVKFIRDNEYYDFICPDESLSNKATYIYMTNLNIDYECNRNKDLWKRPIYDPPYAIITDENLGIYDKKVKVYDKLANIPEDETDYILVPTGVIYDHVRRYYDIYRGKNKFKYSDGKNNRFARRLVKKKCEKY